MTISNTAYGTSQGLMLSTGTITNDKSTAPVIYSGVPNPIPPAQIVQAAIAQVVGGFNQRYPLDLDTTKFPTMTLQLKQWMGTNLESGTNQTLTGGSAAVTQGTWYLPIPTKGLTDTRQIIFEEKDLFHELGSLVEGGLTAMAIGGMRSAAKAIGASAAVENFPNLGSVVGDTARAKFGGSINAFKSILLNGPEFRRFSFQYLFAPRSPAESSQLQRLLQTLRAAAQPALGPQNLVWKFPMLWCFSFTTNGQYLFKFKPAVCSTIQIEYNPGQGSWFRPQTQGGAQAPSTVAVSLNLTEVELWSQQDILGQAAQPGIFSSLANALGGGAAQTPATTQNPAMNQSGGTAPGISSSGSTTIVPGL